MEEIYRDIPGYEGMYQCSNLGNVKALRREYFSGANHKISKYTEEKQVNQYINRYGYLQVFLSKEGKIKRHFVHRLVVYTFPDICGVWSEGLEVNHKDECRTNNCVTNLEVCTKKYNCNYGSHKEKISKAKTKYWDRVGRRTEEEIKEYNRKRAHEYYLKNKLKLDEKHLKNYYKNRDAILAKRKEQYKKKKAG